MIRINLLPVREARRKASIRHQGALVGFAAVAGVLVCVLLHMSISSRISSEEARLQEARVQLVALEETRKEVDRFREEKLEIERKLAVIADLEGSRTGPVRILDDIATRIPSRMWLRSLTVGAGAIDMAGLSLDAEIVAAFMTSLEQSPLITSVELEETHLEEEDGVKLSAFTIRSTYSYASLAVPASKVSE